MIPKQDRMGRGRKTDPREVFDAIRYVLASSSWPPRRFRTVPARGCAAAFPIAWWMRCGILRGIVGDAPGGGAAAAIVNSRNVKATETGYDTGKQIEDRKRHMAMDTEGLPIVLQVHKHRERAPDVSGLFAAGGRAGTRLRG